MDKRKALKVSNRKEFMNAFPFLSFEIRAVIPLRKLTIEYECYAMSAQDIHH
jgi:hypothetical protein